jgi:hypothetical protein
MTKVAFGWVRGKADAEIARRMESGGILVRLGRRPAPDVEATYIPTSEIEGLIVAGCEGVSEDRLVALRLHDWSTIGKEHGLEEA